MEQDTYDPCSLQVFQLLGCSLAGRLQQSILWVLIMESRCGALSQPSSISPISARRLILSFPFQIKLKKILLASFTNHACSIKDDWNNECLQNLNSANNSKVSPPPYP